MDVGELEAIAFLRRFNAEVFGSHPDAQTIAEESTAWPMVSRPVYLGGLGFGLKWDMGWMHDTLEYFAKDPIHRKYHHDKLTFRMIYAFSENFVLPLSHDEVVHGKGSLAGKSVGHRQKLGPAADPGDMYAHRQEARSGRRSASCGSVTTSEPDWHLLPDPRHEACIADGGLNVFTGRARPAPLDCVRRLE